MTEEPILMGDAEAHAALWNGLNEAVQIVAWRNQQSPISTAVGFLYAMRIMLMQVDEKATRELLKTLASLEEGNVADEEKARKAAHRIYRAADALAEREGAQVQ